MAPEAEVEVEEAEFTHVYERGFPMRDRSTGQVSIDTSLVEVIGEELPPEA